MNYARNMFFAETEPPSGLFPVNAYSALNLFRSYNYLLAPQTADIIPRCIYQSCQPQPIETSVTQILLSPKLKDHSESDNYELESKLHSSHQFFLSQCSPNDRLSKLTEPCSKITARRKPIISSESFYQRRHRGEKRTIPEEQKDDKYFERRRKNNQAAKKSRDARKFREDQIALRATMLEHENSMLKAQVLALKKEAVTLKQMIYKKEQ